jgi:hypothetical protein
MAHVGVADQLDDGIDMAVDALDGERRQHDLGVAGDGVEPIIAQNQDRIGFG